MYCLVVTDDYSRFTWVFFLASKDETSAIIKIFITGIENLVDHKVKVIRCDNRTELENKEMNQFCEMKGIMRQYSVARTPQQNGAAERRNKTLIEVARTMLDDSKLPTTFWAEAVNTACYVQNKVLVVKPHNKTPYELFHGRTPALSFMRPFGCPVTILNTKDHLGKFDGKADEGFFVGYTLNCKAFRVDEDPSKGSECKDQEKEDDVNNTNNVIAAGINRMDVKRAFLYGKIKEEKFWATVKVKIINGEVQLQALMDGKKVTITESTIRRDLQLEDAEGVDCLLNAAIFEQLTLMGKPRRKVNEVSLPSDPIEHATDKAVNEEMYDSLERAATTVTSLDAEQDRGNIFKTQSKETPNEPGSQGTSSDDGPRCQETIRDTIAQTSVLDLETTNTTQALEIDSLKRRVKKLERKKWSRTHGLKRLYKIGLSARVESSEDEGLGEEDASKQGRINLHGEEVFVAKQDENVVEKEVDAAQVQVSIAATSPTINEATLAQALAELKYAKPKAKAKGIVFHESKETELVLDSSRKAKAEVTEGSSKRAEEEIKQESSMKKKDGETLWKLVKAKHGSTRLEDGYERVLWGDLKVMFDPHVEDEVWKLQQRYSVMRWTLFNSCRVHFWTYLHVGRKEISPYTCYNY
nr:ribonuclease H-like domain-containing protein [Tanacetum cinerariifolium]